MKKILTLIAVSAIFSVATYADEAVAPTAAKPEVIAANPNLNSIPAEDAMIVADNMKLISKAQHLSDAKLNYVVDISYPQIQGANISANAKQFNKMIENIVTEEVNQFKKNVAIDTIHSQTLPEELRNNSLKVDYDIDLVKPKNQTIISVRMSFEGMQAGRPHPYHNNRVINFDLSSGKVLALNELFKPNSKFLSTLAEYTKKTLDQKLKQDNWMVTQGTKPEPKNFRNWNLQADSILITFDEYQVAPYVYGKQEVEVPYSALSKVLANQSPIADCAKDTKNCQIG